MQPVKIVKVGTKVYKGRDGWTAKTNFKIEGGPQDGRHVKVSTWKGDSGIYTSAQVLTIGSSGGFQTETFAMFSDPNKTLVRPEKTRTSEKTIAEQHERGLLVLQTEIENGWLA